MIVEKRDKTRNTATVRVVKKFIHRRKFSIPLMSLCVNCLYVFWIEFLEITKGKKMVTCSAQ